MKRDAEGVETARKALRLRSHELARIAGLRPSQFSRIKTGKARVPAYLDMILAFLERDESAVRFALDRTSSDEPEKKKKTTGRPRGRPRKKKSAESAESSPTLSRALDVLMGKK